MLCLCVLLRLCVRIIQACSVVNLLCRDLAVVLDVEVLVGRKGVNLVFGEGGAAWKSLARGSFGFPDGTG